MGLTGFRGEILGISISQGYAIVGAAEREAIRLFAQCEGVLLDPLYSGQAAAGLISLIRQGSIQRDEHVLFWHTGGTTGLFAFANQLAD